MLISVDPVGMAAKYNSDMADKKQPFGLVCVLDNKSNLAWMKISFITSVLVIMAIICSSSALTQPYEAGLDKFFKRKMKRSDRIGLQAAMLVNGELRWVGSYGIKEYQSTGMVNDSTIFMIASTSKPVTALALMKLYDEGKVSLDEDVNVYLPFDLVNPNHPDQSITLRMLLAHVSSIRDNWDVLELGYTLDQGGDSRESLGGFLKSYLTEGGAYYDANKNYYNSPSQTENYYSNVGYGLIGYIVECVSGMPFNQYMSQEVFRPLNMDNTFWLLSEVPHDNIASPHNLPYKETTYRGTQILNHFGYPNYPSGQLRTTVTDYAQIIKMILNDGKVNGSVFIGKKTVDEFLNIQFPDIDKWQAISWSYNEFEHPIYYLLMPRYPSHTGLDPGMSSVVSFDPETGNAAIIFSNSPTTTLWCEKIIYLDMVKKLMNTARKI